MGTPLKAFVTLMLVSGLGLVGVTAQPASAACARGVPTGSPISDTPWPQKIWDLDKLPRDATGKGIKVAVIDSGVDAAHPQLQGKIIENIDKLRNVPTPEDCIGHGTAVAGLIAGTKMEGIPFRGLAHDAQILSARVSENMAGDDNADQASVAEVADTVRWAVDRGAKVINISFAYKPQPGLEPLRDAIAYAIGEGVVVVAAVGNDNHQGNPTPYPAAWPGVVGVAAIGHDGYQKLEASQEGSFVDIAAPGVQVQVPMPVKGYARVDGTSFATPLVAATAALIFDRFSEQGITGEQVVERLLATTDPAPGGRGSDGYGVGVLNPLRAVSDVIDDQTPRQAQALPGDRTDPAALEAAKRAEMRREQALWIAGIGLVAIVLAVALMVALPAGIRRRWRPAGR